MKSDLAVNGLFESRTVSYCATVKLAHASISTLNMGVIPMEYNVLPLGVWPL
jgi:hypothetical protein